MYTLLEYITLYDNSCICIDREIYAYHWLHSTQCHPITIYPLFTLSSVYQHYYLNYLLISSHLDQNWLGNAHRRHIWNYFEFKKKHHWNFHFTELNFMVTLAKYNIRRTYALFHQGERCTRIAKLLGPTWGPPGSCWSQMSPMLSQWTLLSGHTFDLNRK